MTSENLDEGMLALHDILDKTNFPQGQQVLYPPSSSVAAQPPTPRLAPHARPPSPAQAASRPWTPLQEEEAQQQGDRPQRQQAVETQPQQGVYGPWTSVQGRSPTPYPRFPALSISESPPPAETERETEHSAEQLKEPKITTTSQDDAPSPSPSTPEQQHPVSLQEILNHPPSSSSSSLPFTSTQQSRCQSRILELRTQLCTLQHEHAQHTTHLTTLQFQNAALREVNNDLRNRLESQQNFTLRIQEQHERLVAAQLDHQANVMRREHGDEMDRVYDAAERMRAQYEEYIEQLRLEQEFITVGEEDVMDVVDVEETGV